MFLCVGRLYRSAEHTNQRILFDIEPCGQYLGTGGQVSFEFSTITVAQQKMIALSIINFVCFPFCFQLFKDGLVHIYDLQTGQWISGFQAAAGSGQHLLMIFLIIFSRFPFSSSMPNILLPLYTLQTLLTVFLSIRSCQWLPHRQDTEDFLFQIMAVRICI